MLKVHGSLDGATNSAEWQLFLESYKTYVNYHDTVLEIGAANIARTRVFSHYCRKLIGVEYVAERTPKNFDNVKYITGDWQKLTSFIKPKSIDVAVSTHTIEHVENDLKGIDELYQVLKPRGVALINTPNRKRLVRSIIELFAGAKQFPWGEHYREYIEADLIDLIRASRFKRFVILPRLFGIQGRGVFIYLDTVPPPCRRLAVHWEIHLFRDE